MAPSVFKAMRTLPAALLAEQQKSTYSPAIRIWIGITDYSPRLKNIRHIERPWGGTATILLDNSDGGLTALDFRGKKVKIQYGFEGVAEYSEAPNVYVLSQRLVSREGELNTLLSCIDLFNKVRLHRIIGGGGLLLTGTITGIFQSGMKVRGQTSGATAEIITVGSNWLHVGRVAETFTAGETVAAVGFAGVSIAGISITNVGGGKAPGWEGTTPIWSAIASLLTGTGLGFSTATSDPLMNNQPRYITQVNASVLDAIQDLINMTKSILRVAPDSGGFQSYSVATTPATPDYTYDTAHAFFSDIRNNQLVLPNSVIVVNSVTDENGITTYSGAASDAGQIALFQEVKEVLNFEVLSNAEAQNRADARLRRLQLEATRGTIIVPMNVAHELFDYIRIIDSRAAIDYYGWIGGLERIWEPGIYRLTIELGGTSSFEAPPEDAAYPLPNLGRPITPPVSSRLGLGWIIPKAVQGYHHDITFEPDGQTWVKWSAGTIRFYDGTTQAINLGSASIGPALAIGYVYFDLGDAAPNVLKITSNYVGVMTIKTGVLCIAQSGSDASIQSSIFPSYGKQPLITADVIYLTGLLDRLPDGTYAKALATQIQAGYLKLTSSTVKSGVWYRESGVKLDADLGITIYGPGTALTTRPSEFGAIQCYVGSDGSIFAGGGTIKLDVSGLTIRGQVLNLQDSGSVIRGYLYGSTDGHLILQSALGQHILLQNVGAGDAIRLESDNILIGPNQRIGPRGDYEYYLFFRTRNIGDTASIDHTFAPSNTLWGKLGSESKKWWEAWTDSLYVYQLRRFPGFSSIRVSLGHTDLFGPVNTNDGQCGNTSIYWSQMAAYDVYYKALIAFQEQDDVGLVKACHRALGKPKVKEGKHMVEDLSDVPSLVKSDDGNMISTGKLTSLLIGAVAQMAERLETLEGRL